MKRYTFVFLFSISLLSLFLFGNIAFSQNFHRDFWDGEVYLKLYLNATEKPPLFQNTKEKEKWNVPMNTSPFWLKAIDQFNIEMIRKASVNDDPQLQTFYHIKIGAPERLEAFMELLKAQKFTENVERNPIFRTVEFTPNDIDSRQWAIYKINARQAWGLSKGSQEIVVAIIDDAVRITHNDLRNNIWVNTREIPNNGRDDDGNGFVDDVNGFDVADRDNNPNPPASASNNSFTHGTHCAGIASATTNNGTGIASIGFNVKIMPVKCTRDDGDPRFIERGYDGVDYAIKSGANVISMSWGSRQGGGALMTQLFRLARERGIVCVGAAGNDNTQEQFFPAAADNVIAVGATDRNDRKARFSNYGTWIDIMAPGADIFSTLAGNDNSYGYQSGTSMACPMVAGLVGLMLSYNPNLTPDEVLNCLVRGADDINGVNPGLVGRLGGGRINAFNAVNCLPPEKLENDITAAYFTEPKRFTCNNTVVPIVHLHNPSKSVIRSVTLYYRLENEVFQVYNWIGVLDTMASVDVALNPIMLREEQISQPLKIKLYTSLPNGLPDENTDNDTTEVVFSLLPSARNIPFREDFESRLFSTNRWSIDNPDNNYTWETVLTQGIQNSRFSARVNCYRYPDPGQRDGLVSPPLDLTNADSVLLDFRHSYRRRSQAFSDSLIIYISNDCGETFVPIFRNGGGNGFATGTIIGNQNFIPAAANEWCGPNNQQECFRLNLSRYKGQKILIKFEVFNANGNNIYLDNINISVLSNNNQPPTASFKANRNEICSGEYVSFTNTSINAQEFYWEFEGAEPPISFDVHPTVQYINSGKFSVKLNVRGPNGQDVTEQTEFIHVITPPNIALSSPDTLLCKGSTTVLKATGGINYFWEPTTGLNTTTGDEVIASPSVTTTYTLTGINARGCLNKYTFTILVSEQTETLNISADKTTICEGQSVNLTVIGPNDSDFHWYPTTGLNTDNGSEVIARPTRTTTYTVISRAKQGCVASDTITIHVLNVPIKLGRTTSVQCADSIARISVKGASRYEWTPNEGITWNGDTLLFVSPKQTTTYTITGFNGECSGTLSLFVDVKTIEPKIESDRDRVNLLFNSSVQFRDLTEGGKSWFWDFADGSSSTQKNPTHLFRVEGIFKVILEVNNGFCTDTAVKYIEVGRFTGIDEHLYTNNVVMFPNPAGETVHITTSEPNSIHEIYFINTLGQEVLRLKPEILSDKTTLNLRELPAGVYQTIIIGKSGIIGTQKLMIQR